MHQQDVEPPSLLKRPTPDPERENLFGEEGQGPNDGDDKINKKISLSKRSSSVLSRNQEFVGSIPLPKCPETDLDSEVPDQELSDEKGQQLRVGEETKNWN